LIRHWLVPVYLLACLLLGGASAAGFVANLVLQLMALPLAGWSLWQISHQGLKLSCSIRALLLIATLLIVVALVQLLPLPPAIWTALPGRRTVVENYHLLGVTLPWLPLTLAPEAALASLLWLLPAFAVLLGMVAGGFRGRNIAVVLVVVALVSVVLGALQMLGGGAYFYRFTNYGFAVGFFANANHNATLLLVTIPFLAALGTTLLSKRASARSASAIRLLIGSGYAVIGVGLLLNGSLAGIGIGVPVTMATWLTFGRMQLSIRRRMGALAILLSIAAVWFIAVNPGNNLFGIQRENVELSRQTSFALTLRAAGEYFPIGSGIGSFQPVYRTQEPLISVGGTFMNHAHSDWLELLLETGLAGVVLAVTFLGWWGLRVRAIWRAEQSERFAHAAIIATFAMMLHSVVDYPLRTVALSAVFAMCLSLMAGVRPLVIKHRHQTRARHLKIQ